MNTFTLERNNCRRKLILLVKQHPILWNKTQENYNRNRPQKLQTWQEISQQIGISVDKIRRTWENLRDQYRRDLKREVKYGFKSKWRFFNDMDFIRDMVTCKGQPNEFTDSDSEMEPNDMPSFLKYDYENDTTYTEPPAQISESLMSPKSTFQPIMLTKQWQQTTTSDISSSLLVSTPRVPSPIQTITQETPTNYPPIQVAQKCDSSKDFGHDLPNPLELMEMLAKREPETDIEIESECVAAIAEALPSNAIRLEAPPRIEQEFHQEAFVSTSSLKHQVNSPTEDHAKELTRSSATGKRKKSLESADLEAKDEDYYFVMSLLPSMRQIPRNRKIALRIGIMNLIAKDLEEVCK